jgi:hypothetical protein
MDRTSKKSSYPSQTMNLKDRIRAHFLDADFPIADLENRGWTGADAIFVRRSWSGSDASESDAFTARLLWSESALYVRFDANQNGPCIVSGKPDLATKTLGLWERDVCELFIAPDPRQPRRYFEFEVAPSGEWIDLTIDLTASERKTDWDYRSGMESAARIGEGTVLMGMKIPWTAFGKVPAIGEVWRGNLFRCVGEEPDRRYLAWQPTMTAEPQFHVPEKFGEFVFER